MNIVSDRAKAGLFLVFIFLLSGYSMSVRGQMIPLPNPSFESGTDSPDGWHFLGKQGKRTKDAAAGDFAVTLAGKENSQASTYWYTDPLPFEANACYRLSFYARRVSGSGGSPIAGPKFCNRDLHEVTSEWQRYLSYFAAPSSPVSVPLCLGQWNVGGVIAFDEVSLVQAEPVYRHYKGITLGEGEYIAGDQYVFTAPFRGDSANHARTLAGYDCFFNKPRWVFSKGKWVIYHHEVNTVMQVAGEIEVTLGHYRGGVLVAEASADGDVWLEVGVLDELGTLKAALPESLFPAARVMIRFTVKTSAESDSFINLQLYGYTYRATLAHAAHDFQGSTRFVAVPESDRKVHLDFEGFGDSLPGGENELRFLATNLTENPLSITPCLSIISDDGSDFSTSIAPIILPENSSGGMSILVPYEIPGTGDVLMSLDLGEEVSYCAETRFNVSCLFESGYGLTLPDSSDDVALWWASSGWKVSKTRSVPEKSSEAMRFLLARNEREAAQFVLRPTEPLHNLHVISQTLQSETGVILPADAVEILRVAYVPVTQPTDSVGTVAPWPDPLPPLAGAINLDAGENQPFWVCIHTQTNTPAVVYKGTLLLEADGWRGSVPLEVEVFDFSLPDRKTCVSAFGFNAPLAFRYHHVDTEFDRRKVYEEYLSILSNHHISIYNPAFLDPIQYDWSHLPEWQGGERDNTVSYRGQVSLLLRDESETANVAVSYDEPFSIPDEGLHIEFQYKTGEPGHSFLATVQYFDISGTWIRGNNTDITIEGDASWQHFAKTVNDFPKEAHQFKLRLWATPFNEEGVYTGNVWIDDIKLSTDVVLIQDDFETWDTGELKTLFVPEFDWTAWDTAMTRAFDHYHFNGFRLSIPGLGSGTFHARSEPSLLGYGENTEEYKIAFSMWCRLVETHLREKGWLDDAYVYWFDEPDPDDYKFVMNGFRKLKETAPGLNRMLTEQIESELVGGPNIWCPISNQYDHNMAEQRRAAGEKNWWYVCTGPKAPYATLFIDHPATELRVWLWQTWKRAIDGILIWQTNYWHSNTAYPDGLQNPYEDPMGWVSGYSTPIGTKRPWGNGDGRFIYPPLAAVDSGTDNPVFDAPVSSIRLEMLRDGIEDYEYCVILRDLLEAYKDNLPESDLAKYKKLLEVPETITQSLTEFTWNPAPIEAQREAVARAIVQINKRHNKDR